MDTEFAVLFFDVTNRLFVLFSRHLLHHSFSFPYKEVEGTSRWFLQLFSFTKSITEKFPQSISRDLFQRAWVFCLFTYDCVHTLKYQMSLRRSQKIRNFSSKRRYQIWPNTAINLGNSSNNSMPLHYTTKSHDTFNLKVTFYPFLSIIIDISIPTIYSGIAEHVYFFTQFFSDFWSEWGQEILSRKKVIRTRFYFRNGRLFWAARTRKSFVHLE